MKNGKLVSRVESVFLAPSDFSPRVRPERSETPRVFVHGADRLLTRETNAHLPKLHAGHDRPAEA